MKLYLTEIPNHFNLPRRIRRLGELAYNRWWTWNPDAQRLYLRIDRLLWEEAKHNPARFLRIVDRPKLNAIIQDRYFLEFYDRIFRSFDQYMNRTETWYSRNHSEFTNRRSPTSPLNLDCMKPCRSMLAASGYSPAIT